jgi:hypothetical protein
MRVNLLPREPDVIRLAGLSIQLHEVRKFVGVVLVATTLFLGMSGVQIWREQRLAAAASVTETLLDLHEPQRNRIAALARDVSILQRIERESAVARHSGNDAGHTLVRLGNAISSGAWLKALDRRPDGYFISGGARDLATVARTLDDLDRATPPARAYLTSIGQGDGALTFSIRMSESTRMTR